jgi:hypothetical protein
MRRKGNHRLVNPTLVLVAGLAALAGLAGCAQPAGGSAGNPATQHLSASADPQDQALRFARCMREHGVPMSDPKPGGSGIEVGGPNVDPQVLREAQRACQPYAPFGDGSGQQQPDPKIRELVLKFAQCMRDNGVPNFPDPQVGMMQLDENVTRDPDFPKAERDCEQKYLSNIPGTW